MSLVELKLNPSARELRQFALLLVPVSAGIGALLWSKGDLTAVAYVTWAIGGLLGAVGAWRPALLRPAWIVWMIAAFPIGWVVSHVMLAMIWYLCLTPIAIGMRLCGFDPLERKIERTRESYWTPHSPTTDTSRYFRQF